MASPAGWYPDPKSGGQRYFDGKDWTDQTAPGPSGPVPAPPPQSVAQAKRPGCFRSVLGVVGVLFVIGLIGHACSSDDKKSSSSSSSPSSPSSAESSYTYSSASPTPTTPAGPVKPDATFTADADGSVTASFAIHDNLTEGFIKDGARFTTIDILKYSKLTYPDAPQVNVRGSFPMKDAYGNTSTDLVVNLTYLKSTIDQINFEGVDKDKIWEIADSGYIAPAFRP